MALVLRHGYDAVSVDDIVRVTGVGRGSLYQAFGSKSGVIARALQQAIDDAHPDRLEFAVLLLASSAANDAYVHVGLVNCLSGFPSRVVDREVGAVLLNRMNRGKD